MIKSWKEFFDEQRVLPYYQELKKKVDMEYKTSIVYPPYHLILNAFKLTPLKETKVIIMGQDPYHNPNQAMGLSFSVPSGEKLPPSLKNIYKEIGLEYKVLVNQDGDLTYLAKQGVLLLNSLLTVRKNEPLSHQNYGYEILIRNVIELLDQDDNPKVFMLWGAPARKIIPYIKNKKHLILTSAHPSPLSAYNGFFNNNHFIKANKFLVNNGLTPINWINE